MTPLMRHRLQGGLRTTVVGLLVLVAFWCSAAVASERLKDIASLAGVRSNQLVGYGLVVGLDGTGDQTNQAEFTLQTFRNMLQEFGIQVPPDQAPQLRNVAAVTIHAELPAFARPGQTIDVTVSSLGNAKSLRGGTLLMTPLRGMDRQTYAMAQGNLVVGGFGADGADGSSITVNVPSVGRIPGGAIVERPSPTVFGGGDRLEFLLNRPDFTTSQRITSAINRLLGPGVARSVDAGTISVGAPRLPDQRVAFVSMLENIEIESGAAPARVIVNSRTGTVVIGQNVRVSPAAVSHGSLTVTIREDPAVSQPNALGEGQTVVVPDSELEILQEDARMFHFQPGVDLADLVRAVNKVGTAPGDLMAILEALRQAGALQAELVVI